MKTKILALILCAALMVSFVAPLTLSASATETVTTVSKAEALAKSTETTTPSEAPTEAPTQTTQPSTQTAASAQPMVGSAPKTPTAPSVPETTVPETTVPETSVPETTGAATEPTQGKEPDKTIQVGDTLWIKSGTSIFKSPQEQDGHAVTLSYKIKITQIVEGGWYKFEFADLSAIIGNFFLKGYNYVRTANTSVEQPTEPDATETSTEPTQPEHTCDCVNPPENLAQHADSCPRKQYIKSLVAEKTAAQIYENWNTYDKATQTDILNITQAYYATTYTELLTLIGQEEGEKNTTVDGVSLSLTGVPETATLSATKVTRTQFHEELLDKIGSHKLVFSMDITLKNGEETWQPQSGQKVTVTLDAKDLNLKEGDKIGILHEHDGKLMDLGKVTVVDGKLTFETTGFSTFYGYTVDFEYDGTWHSISGGSGIYLQDLFDKLGIDRDAKNVIKLEFSDPSLIEITKRLPMTNPNVIEELWYLQTLKAFETEELLTVTFSGGEVLKINVYDAITNYAVWNDGTVETRGTDTGTAYIGSPGMRLTINGKVTINVSGTVTIYCQFYIPTGSTLRIRSVGQEATILADSSLTDQMFYVDGGKLDIRPFDNDGEGEANDNKGWITIDGQNAFTVTDDQNHATGKNLTGGNQNMKSACILMLEGITWMHRVKFRNFLTGTGGNASVFHAMPKDFNERIDSNHSTLAMRDCVVTNCATLGSNSVIETDDCVATLEKCEIKDCYSGVKQYGGVVKGSGNYFSQLTMRNCTLSGNYSSGWGGAILWASGVKCGNLESKAIIQNCTFTNNTAKWLGGAISNEAVMEITGTTIKNNKAQSGGGIAAFPFTLYEGGLSLGTSLGLTLGEGNVISNNSAESTAPWHEDITQSGDKTHIKYNAGGGGIWVFCNMENWTGELNIGKGNTISNNKANCKGGGVDINTIDSSNSTTTLNITGATIEKNQAPKGAGVALYNSTITIDSGSIQNNTASAMGGGVYLDKGTCTISGNGSISSNTVNGNGGGVYIETGTINVSGGIISQNQAKGNETFATAQQASKGVGGGIYLKNGTFTLSGENVGLHSNLADVAANDAYATGCNTTLVLPEVKNMNLTGYAGAKPIGWFADYQDSESNYPGTVLGKANPGRYDYFKGDGNLEVTYPVLSANQTTYYCLTLGLPHPGYGSLQITKELSAPAKETQTFVFNISGSTLNRQDYSMQVTINIQKGENKGTVSIPHLPDGTYKIQEEDWSWRYTLTGKKLYPKDGDAIDGMEFTLNSYNPDWFAEFTNSRTEDHWLSGDADCRNWWGNKNQDGAATS